MRPAPDGGFEVQAAIPAKEGLHVTIRVVLADDQALLRATFRLLLDSEPDMEVVAEPAPGPRRSRGPGTAGQTWC